jgi:NAD(P)-dependent dehydrogenase (short-subunit alcohol dehydrogenase family)
MEGPALGETLIEMKDKVALITGGSEGIDRGIAEALAHEEAKITIAGRHEDALKTSACSQSPDRVPDMSSSVIRNQPLHL